MNKVIMQTSGLAAPDSIVCFFGVRVRIVQKAGANAKIRERYFPANRTNSSARMAGCRCKCGFRSLTFWIPYDVTHCLGMRSSLKCRKVTCKMCVVHPRKWLRFLEQFWLIWKPRICDFASAWPSFASASPMCSFQQDKEYII